MSGRKQLPLATLRLSLRLSIRALGRSRWRTLSAAGSMAIGIAAVTVLLGVGAGAERAFRQALEEMGENLLVVSAERSESGGPRGAGRQVETLTLDDSRAISAELDSVARAAPISLAGALLRRGKREIFSTALGTTPAFARTNNQRLAAGRFLDADDVAGRARVAILGARVAQDLFFGELPLGELLLVDENPFVVVGVLERRGADPTGADLDDRVLVPVETLQRRLSGVDYIDRIFVQARSRRALDEARSQVTALLSERHGEDDFTVRDQAALLETLEAADRSFSSLLGGLAALTLGLASLGLLAVSLLSVRERRGEIGLRLAVGARPRHVLLQFLAETVMIAILGAGLGLLAGGAGIIVGERLLGWRLAWSLETAAYPFLVAVAVAALCGVYPAARAAQLDPIRTLRAS